MVCWISLSLIRHHWSSKFWALNWDCYIRNNLKIAWYNVDWAKIESVKECGSERLIFGRVVSILNNHLHMLTVGETRFITTHRKWSRSSHIGFTEANLIRRWINLGMQDNEVTTGVLLDASVIIHIGHFKIGKHNQWSKIKYYACPKKIWRKNGNFWSRR